MSGEKGERLRDRFKSESDELARRYVASIPFDRRLYRQDIAGSITHARMLAKQGIISNADSELIISSLVSIRDEIDLDEFVFRPELEDIHMNIESRLFEMVGDIAGKLHTARSRNDQIALDMRIFVKEAVSEAIDGIKGLQQALLDIAEANSGVIMPGYTHLQRAQPILFAHHLLAYFEMFQRDIERFQDCFKRTDVLPLGSGALAGVAYAVDRDFLAHELGFEKVSANSLDAVSDRDFVIEYEAAAAFTMMHLSRLAEEVILWSTTEFGFVDIDESYATSSSIMPQKKNPDVVELARGKTGRVYGNLMGFLTVMKALPLAYNRDMQEDKESLFDTVDTLLLSLEVFAGVIKTMRVDVEQMRYAADGSYDLATDLADYLAKRGLPFREAHSVVGKLVRYAIDEGKGFQELSLDEYHKFSSLFAEDIYNVNIDTSVAARDVVGGTAPKQMELALRKAREVLRGG